MENARLVWKCTGLHTTLRNLPVELMAISWKPGMANVCRVFLISIGLRTKLPNLPVCTYIYTNQGTKIVPDEIGECYQNSDYWFPIYQKTVVFVDKLKRKYLPNCCFHTVIVAVMGLKPQAPLEH